MMPASLTGRQRPRKPPRYCGASKPKRNNNETTTKTMGDSKKMQRVFELEDGAFVNIYANRDAHSMYIEILRRPDDDGESCYMRIDGQASSEQFSAELIAVLDWVRNGE